MERGERKGRAEIKMEKLRKGERKKKLREGQKIDRKKIERKLRE